MLHSFGDVVAGQILMFMFSTTNPNGCAVASTTVGNVYIYKDDDATATTDGVTYTPSFDGVAGINMVRLDTGHEFYEAGHNYNVVLVGAVVPGALGCGPVTINMMLAKFSVVTPVVPDAGSFTGAFPASVLANAPRTGMVLSATSLARGPEAALTDADIPITVFKNGSPRLTAPRLSERRGRLASRRSQYHIQHIRTDRQARRANRRCRSYGRIVESNRRSF